MHCPVSLRPGALRPLPAGLLLSVLAVPSAAHAVPLEFDSNFGGTGEVFLSGAGYVSAIKLQSDGKIVAVAGGSTPLMRLNSDGSFDSSFGSGGKVAFSASTETLTSVAIQSDGKILVAGSAGTGSAHSFEVARVNTDGSFDSSFGSGGKITVAFSDDAIAASLALQSDGKILVAGQERTGSTFGYAVARLNGDGSLDSTFNGTGKLIYVNGNGAYNVTVQSDGKILLAGSDTSALPASMCAVRLNSDGSFDNTFGVGGKARASFGGNVSSGARNVAVASDGRIVLGGSSSDSSGGYMGVARLNSDGSLDTSFNGTGTEIPQPGINRGLSWAFGLSLMPDGKIVLSGDGEPVFAKRAAVVLRLNADGSTDTSFNDSGAFFFPHQSSAPTTAGCVLTPDASTVLLSGDDLNGSSDSGFIARLKMDLSAPSVSITSPAANANLLPSTLLANGISGVATDDVGVSSVSIKLYRDRGGVRQYWNGTAFTTASVTVPGTVSHSGAASTAWHLAAMPSSSDLDLGSYSLYVTATDVKGKVSAPARSSFTLVDDVTAPTVTVLHPTANQVLLPATFVSNGVDGTAADNVAVASVSVKLYRTNAGVREYWNGAAWTTASVAAPVNLTGAGTASASWTLASLPDESSLISGPYGAQAVAKDTAGNSATVTRSFSIVTDATPPTAGFTSPGVNGHVSISAFDANTVRGTASDNLAVASVSLKLFRTRSGVKEFWNGTAFVTTSVAAPLNATGLGTANVTWNLSPAPSASSLDAGAYSAQISAKDAAGNTSTIVTRNFTIDAASAGAAAGVSAESF